MSAPYILLGFFILPLWILAGFADYLCHRAAHIEQSSGTRESLLHLIQFSLVGLPVTLALFLKANAGFFLASAVVILLHHLTAYIDVRYADASRKVEPREQMVHSFLELLPVTAYLLLAVAEWKQFLALFGLGAERAVFVPQVRPLSGVYATVILAAAFLLNAVPYLEELMRCIGAMRTNKN
jgi:hypothetical protein